MIPPWASLQRVAIPALFVCVVCVAAMESAASSKRSRTLQKNTRATNHAIAAVELLSQLGCQRIIAWSDADVRLAVLVKALSGRSDLALQCSTRPVAPTPMAARACGHADGASCGRVVPGSHPGGRPSVPDESHGAPAAAGADFSG